jgi:ABC-type glycerol-3-phosphate transport system permease component
MTGRPGPARLLAYALLVAACALSLLPTIYMIDISLRDSADSFAPVLITPHPTLANYAAVFAHGQFAGFFVNSVLISLATVLLTLICVVCLAYAISRLKVRGGNIILLVVMSALLLPLASLLIPITVLLRTIGLTNSYLGLIGPETALGIAFGTVIVKGAMDGIPAELEEAAIIDGAGSLAVLLRIVTPLVRPSLLVVAVWQFLFSWNEFFLALVIMTQNAMKTLPLAPLFFEGPYMTDPGKLFAILTLIGVVPMLFYAVLQRWFVSGLMAGGVKG